MRDRAIIALLLAALAPTVCEAQASTGVGSLRAVRDSIASERLALQRAVGDSGLLQLALVRQLYRIGRPAEGRITLLAAASPSSPAANAALRKEILLGMPGSISLTGRWDKLTPAARRHELQSLWDDCDVDLAQPVGFCLENHYQRVLYAYDHFQSPVRTADQDLDVRGQVWIKQGAPEKRVLVPGDISYEIWRYDHPFGPMILYFTDEDSLGRRGPLRLVASLEDAPLPVRMAVCTVDSESCTRGARPVPIPGMFSEPAWIREDTKVIFGTMSHLAPRRTVRGESAASYANRIRYTPARFLTTMRPPMQVAVLNGGPGGDRRMLTAIEFRESSLAAEGVGRARRYRIRYQISILDTANVRTDSDTTLTVTAVRSLAGDGIVPAILDFAIPDEIQTLSIAITEPGGNRLLWMAREELWTALPVASSLILGSSRRGMQWNRGPLHLLLNPTRIYEVGDTLVAYIQTAKAPQADSTWGRIVLGDGPAPPSPQHRLVVRPVAIAASAARIEHRFLFPLDSLAPGTYHISFGIWWNHSNSKAQSTTFRFDTFTIRARSPSGR